MVARLAYRVALDDVVLACREWRGARQPEVILLHGLTAWGGVWESVARHIAHRARVLAYDLRGRGDSEGTERGGLDVHLADLAGLISAVVDEPPVLMGHSYGAIVAARFAARNPDALRALVLVDGGTRPPVAAIAVAAQAANRLAGVVDDPLDHVAAVSTAWAWQGRWSADAEASVLGELRREPDGYRVKGIAAVLADDAAGLAAVDNREMRAISCPVAVVRAEHGVLGIDDVVLTDADCELLKELGASIVTVNGARHSSIIIDRPKRVATAFEDVLSVQTLARGNDG